MYKRQTLSFSFSVTPYGGVWIEISIGRASGYRRWSRLMEACGLKWHGAHTSLIPAFVTPYGGVWIEIPAMGRLADGPWVTPYGGVWIEIAWISMRRTGEWSRLMEACGLKYCVRVLRRRQIRVTPYGGVWIEIQLLPFLSHSAPCHALWRRVD